MLEQDLVDPLLRRGECPADLGDLDDLSLRLGCCNAESGASRSQTITSCLLAASSRRPSTAQIARAATDQDHRSGACRLLQPWLVPETQPAHHDHEQPPQSSDHARRHPWPAPPMRRPEVIRRRRATAHDQQSPCREVGDGRTDLGRDYRYHCSNPAGLRLPTVPLIRLRRPALGGRPAQGWRRSLLVAGSAWRREVTTSAGSAEPSRQPGPDLAFHHALQQRNCLWIQIDPESAPVPLAEG